MQPSPMATPLQGVMARYRGASSDHAKRKPGRPKKRTPEYLRTLLATHQTVEAWFIATRGCRPASDRELYTSYFAEQFQLMGERAGRALSPAFQRALKTLRNELAEARRLGREHPRNDAFLGTVNAVK